MRYSIIVLVQAHWYPSVYGQIALPFKDGIIKGIKFDNVPLKLLLDTGLSGTYLVYKDWYERTYGRGACGRLKGGCYSCPGRCDPYARERSVGTFADGTTVTSVVHKGRIGIGKYKLEMSFRLMIGFSPGQATPGVRPVNHLGLAFQTPTSPETIPLQLYNNKMITKYAVSVCSPGYVPSFTGTLILGNWDGLCAIRSPVATFSMIQPREHNTLDSKLFSYGLVSSAGRTFTKEVRGSPAIYDTGAFSIVLPKGIFESLLNQLTSFAGHGVYLKTVDDVWYITDKGYSSFPAVTFSVGSQRHPVTLQIPPKQYAIECDGRWCLLAFVYDEKPDILLGRPFFQPTSLLTIYSH
ncbi:hypothetical protein FOL47_003856 [Perkinsus chesapeaki]|uniref:Peptidase A1 domain-containing protein n=1 Tax=Perkinsus chesapeaki TaxID=330153 RepID=A0A7J6M768_PERCH|nr:hypothetical protein FOL47_003856 [Perkinsus chesapeaki]